LSDGLTRIHNACSVNFLATPEKLLEMLTLLNNESAVMTVKVWLICLLYGNRKEEMTKTEKRELREYSRIKAIELFRRMNEVHTLIANQFAVLSPEELNQMLQATMPLAEGEWEFLSVILKDIIEVIIIFKSVAPRDFSLTLFFSSSVHSAGCLWREAEEQGECHQEAPGNKEA